VLGKIQENEQQVERLQMNLEFKIN